MVYMNHLAVTLFHQAAAVHELSTSFKSFHQKINCLSVTTLNCYKY